MDHSTSNNIKVAVRVRPLNESKENGSERCVDVDTASHSITIATQGPVGKATRSFFFDCVFPEETTNHDLYKELGPQILDGAFNSYNGTIFAYGQTGAGKTFSMSGVSGAPGIVPQMNTELFERVSRATSNAAQPIEFLIQAAYLEIYMEEIHDLLNPSPPGPLKVRESKEKGIYVDNLSWITVKSATEVSELIMQGSKMRQVAATKMNDLSSRSHAIFTLIVQSRLKNEKEVLAQRLISESETSAIDTGAIKASINLVDLAGSERQRDTGASGQTAKQGIMINLSLTCLGTVINSLVKGNSHIPYRDSVLTRILQESLGGNSRTVMLANLSPSDKNSAETLSTLIYADRAKQIVNRVERNETKTDRLIREMREEIARLRRVLAEKEAAASGVQISTVTLSPQPQQPQTQNTSAKDSEERKAQLQLLLESIKLKGDGEVGAEEDWDGIKQRSSELNKTRIENLKKMAFYETLLSSIREEHRCAIELLGNSKKRSRAAKARFEKLKGEARDIKILLDASKEKLERRRTELKDTTQLKDDPLVVNFKSDTTKYKAKYNSIVQELRRLKSDIESAQQQIQMAKTEASASNAFIAGDEKLREEIAKEERERLKRENETKINEERQQLIAEYEKEVNKVFDETSSDIDSPLSIPSTPMGMSPSLSSSTSMSNVPSFHVLPGAKGKLSQLDINNRSPIFIPSASSGGFSGQLDVISATSATSRDAALEIARSELSRQVKSLCSQLASEKAERARLEVEVQRLKNEGEETQILVVNLRKRLEEDQTIISSLRGAMNEMKDKSNQYIKTIIERSQDAYKKLMDGRVAPTPTVRGQQLKKPE